MDIIDGLLGATTIIVTVVISTFGYYQVKEAVEKYRNHK